MPVELFTRRDTPAASDTPSEEEKARFPVSVANSPLYKLSALVRNSIYRLVLIDKRYDDDGNLLIHPVIVHKDYGIREPSLLLTNKFIRSRASPIFYRENHFVCYVANYDPAPVLLLQDKLDMPFDEHPMGIRIQNIEREIGYDTWDNLVWWLHLCREGKVPSLFHWITPDRRPSLSAVPAESTLLEGLFEMAETCPGMSSRAFDDAIAAMYRTWEHCARLNGV